MTGANKGAVTQSDPPADIKDVTKAAPAAADAGATSDQRDTPAPPAGKEPSEGALPKEADQVSLRSLYREEVEEASPRDSEHAQASKKTTTSDEPDEGEEQDQPEGDAAGDEPAADAQPKDGTDESKAEEADPAKEFELTDEDKKEPPRKQKRIQDLLSKLKEADPYLRTGRALDQLQKQSGLDNKELGFGVNVLAALKKGDPRVIPVIENALSDLYELTGQKREQPKAEAPEIPEPEPFKGDLPSELQLAVDFGAITEDRARELASLTEWRKKVAGAKQSAKDKEAQSAKEKQAEEERAKKARTDTDAAQRAHIAAVQEANQQVVDFLKAEKVGDLQAYFPRLRKHLEEDAPNGDPDQIPPAQMLLAAKAAHRAVQLEEVQSKAKASTTTRVPAKTGNPPGVRQTGLGNSASSAKKTASTLRDFYREEAEAAGAKR
jgi:hypothetical protein